VLDYNGDGTEDLLAIRKSDGQMNLYPGNGAGGFSAAVKARTGFDWADLLTSPGDLDADGSDDILVRIGQTQEYWLFLSGSDDGAVVFDTWLGDASQSRRYSEMVGLGDLDQDGIADLALVDSKTGALYRQSIWADDLGSQPTLFSSGWGGMRLPAVKADRAYDHDQDGGNDLIARSTPLAYTFLYTGNGIGGFGGKTEWDLDYASMNLLETAGDFNGDGNADLLARHTDTGTLYLQPGDGVGGYDTAERITVGTGWNAMSTVVSGSDFNGDGLVDIIAREKSTGYLWLYPGKGTGTVGSRLKIGSGWNALKEITAVGDLDHDGHAGLIAVRASDNCMYFYGGKGTGGVDNGVKIGCGWGGLNALAAVGDFNGDGHHDFVARRKSDGKLFLYKGNGAGNFGSSTAIGSGWNAMDLIA
jgi:hypothetical protein